MTRTSLPGMHGRDIQPSAPTSNTAGCGDVGGTSQTACPCRVVPRPATWQLPNRADAAEIGADAAQIKPTWSVSAVSAISVNIGRRPIRPIRPKQAGNRPKQAEIGLEYGCKIRNLHSSFFFCESRPSMCF